MVKHKKVAIGGLLVPSVLLMLYPLSLLWIWSHPSKPEVFDADGMTIIVIGMMVGGGMAISAFVGIPVSYLTLRYLRK